MQPAAYCSGEPHYTAPERRSGLRGSFPRNARIKRQVNKQAFPAVLLLAAILFAFPPLLQAQVPGGAEVRAEIQSVLRMEASQLAIAVALCTIGTVLLLFASANRRQQSDRELLLAGLFALAYAIRALAKTRTVAFLLDDPAWLPFFESSLEYVVPIPASALFMSYFGARLRRANRLIFAAFVTFALIAIPSELVTGRPHLLNQGENALVMIFMGVYLLNLLQGTKSDDADRRLLRIGSAIFGAAVVNEHLNIVRDRFGIVSEATAFLVFISVIILLVVRHSVRASARLASVDGELQAARAIQASILPRSLPRIDGLDVATAYVPASDVAGDYYEFVTPAEGELGILVADVSGHGIAAALVASMLKIGIATMNGSLGRPAELLDRMNRLFCGKLERQFITAAYAHLTAAGLRIASGGHPPPLLFRHATGAIGELEPRGAILGRFPDAEFSDLPVRFERGDVLVLYTDGVTEARNASGEMFGDERLRSIVRESAGSSAESVVQEIRSAVSSWSPQFEDDVTLVVVRRTGAGQAARSDQS